MSDSVSNVASEKSGFRRWLFALFTAIAFLILFSLVLGPITTTVHHPFGSMSMQKAHVINLVLFQYANDHDQRYPDGKNSTEIFQKLLDENYVADPTVFYLPLPGKITPVDGQKLKPENVGFDVTLGIEGSSSDLVPVVFETGYRIDYAPGGRAVPLPPSGLVFTRTWKQWWAHEKPLPPLTGIAVSYKSGASTFLKLKSDPSGGCVPNFISPDFKPDGKVYRQLTPDGVLP